MSRHAVSPPLLLLLVSLAGCGSVPRAARTPTAEPESSVAAEQERLAACLNLEDHIVDLFADAYVSAEGLSMTFVERAAFREGWAEELEKRGTLGRFERACVLGMTPRRYQCGMQSQTPEALLACMRLSEG